MIPCEVIVIQPGTVEVKRPSFPLVDMKLIPLRFGIKQLVRVIGNTNPDVFRLSCADGSVVIKGRYNFTLVLYSDKDCADEVCRAAGSYDGTSLLSFLPAPTTAGSFFYSVIASNSNGDEQTLLSDSYTVKN